MQDSKNLINARQLIEDGVNRRNFHVFDSLCQPDVIYRGPHTVAVGLTEFIEEMRRMVKAFPDLNYSMEYTMANDDRVFVRTVCRSTHHGDWRGMRASHRRLSIPMTWILAFRDGRISDVEVLYDVQNVVSQLSYGAMMGLR